MNTQTININPCPKPRMTQRDKWKQRPVVMRYRAFCDEIRLKHKGELPDRFKVVFSVPMPKSWSKKKKKEMNGQPHQQKPDLDNYLKALCDALREDDSSIYDIRATKVWSTEGSIEINTKR